MADMFSIISLTKAKGKLILIGRAYIARDCYLLLPGLVCKGKIKNKMFKKNVKGMQQILRREFWLAY